MSEVTQILQAIHRGDTHRGDTATDQLLPLVDEERRCIATSKRSREMPRNTLQATALVHEASMHLIGSSKTNAETVQANNADHLGTNEFWDDSSSNVARVFQADASLTALLQIQRHGSTLRT